MADSTAVYCTLQDVYDRLSVAGVTLRIDDDPSAYSAILAEASSWVEQYLLPIYTSTAMLTNRWVKYATAWKAAELFACRRLNPVPASLATRLEKLEEYLEAVVAGRMEVPGLARRRLSVPRVSQPRVTVGPFGPKVVISRKRGTQKRTPSEDYPQPRDPTEPPYEHPEG